MEIFRKYLGSTGDLTSLNSMQAQAVAAQAVAQVTAQQAVVAQQAAHHAAQLSQQAQQQQVTSPQTTAMQSHFAQHFPSGKDLPSFGQQNSGAVHARVSMPSAVVGGYDGSRTHDQQQQSQSFVDRSRAVFQPAATASQSADLKDKSSAANQTHPLIYGSGGVNGSVNGNGVSTKANVNANSNGAGDGKSNGNGPVPFSSGNGTGSNSIEEQNNSILELRRQRRMLSNRESARRSRRRKQDHLGLLETKIKELQEENFTLKTNLRNEFKKVRESNSERVKLRNELETLKKLLENRKEKDLSDENKDLRNNTKQMQKGGMQLKETEDDGTKCTLTKNNETIEEMNK